MAKHNSSATTNPGTGDDNTLGYAVGSQWVNIATGRVFACVDTGTGAAVWAAGVGAVDAKTIEASALLITASFPAFVDAIPGVPLNPPVDGDYFIIFDTQMTSSVALLTGSIAIGKNGVAVAGSSARTHGVGAAGFPQHISTQTRLTGLLATDDIRPLFSSDGGAGTRDITNRRITLIRVQ